MRRTLREAEAGVSQLQAELERLRKDFGQRAQRRTRWHRGRGGRDEGRVAGGEAGPQTQPLLRHGSAKRAPHTALAMAGTAPVQPGARLPSGSAAHPAVL